MCGIAGIINFGARPIEDTDFRQLSNSLIHRGPDDSGEYKYNSERISVVFVHRRLKIIDLSPQAHQPMSNENGRLWLMYNGEIYNYIELRNELISLGHAFKSHSDSEVVIHAYEEWGKDCLDKFIGMWAFAIWDEPSQVLFCARDRIGMKPFYYNFKPDNNFIFASELKSFLCLKKEWSLNHNAVYSFLKLGYCLNSETWIKEIKSLSPGHYLYLKDGNLEINSYWDPDHFTVREYDEIDIKKKLRQALEDSISLHSRSDVKIGAYLSGGIDSSSIVALMCRKSGKPVQTFSGIFNEGSKYDETAYITGMEKAYSLKGKHILITQDRFMETMNELAWSLDEPIVGPGSYAQFCVCETIKSEGFKVVMGGQGGDELFGGYTSYLTGIPSSASGLTKQDSHINGNPISYLNNIRFQIEARLLSAKRLLKKSVSLSRLRIESELNPDILDNVDIAFRQRLEDCPLKTEDMLLWDLKYYLPALLQVEDRIGMAFSIETRLPLLDYRIVELSLSIPFYLKINKYSTKYILRESVKDLLPDEIYSRRDKMGFPTPMDKWLKEEGIKDALREEAGPHIKRLFRDTKDLSWEKALVGLWLKKTKIN
ncbi:MAG: asparagine synthase (glutamine-hydrolyzing) [Candidatus Omnitrophota bacterium]|nr:asparagine synthase (glutamine-hydrolyzing) [Candidatus Omnitrophota bacterium]